jgi:pyruvate,water dikinase
MIKYKGIGISNKIVIGKARIIKKIEDINNLKKKDIAIADIFFPPYFNIFFKCSGLITSKGGALCHGAIVAREYDFPSVFGIGKNEIKENDRIKIDPANNKVIILDP